MNDYQQRVEERRAYLKGKAKRFREQADQSFARAHRETEHIPMGQPILVGHHSEKRHRAALARSDRAMRQGLELQKRANQVEQRAAAVGRGGVSSDDPDAVVTLQADLEEREKQQAFMKRVNLVFRRGGWREVEAEGLVTAAQRKVCEEAMQATPWEKQPFPRYALQNNLANIKRLKARIAELTAADAREDVDRQYDGFRFCIEDNRVRFYFEGKPNEETRTVLKAAAFRWAPSVGAWQRKATANGITAGERLAAQLDTSIAA